MTLICIGGAEDKEGDMIVLKTVLSKAAVGKPQVHVITSATREPEKARERYSKAFGKLGVNCTITHIETAAAADHPALLQKIAAADVIFFSGGDQSRLAAVLNGTAFLEAVKAREKAGAVVAGTSAGAAVMSELMITGGDPDKAHLSGAITTGTGFSFARDFIFDTHFLNCGRLPRLFNLVAAHPLKTGIGLDEDTAAVLNENGLMEVIGSGAVTIVKHRQGGSGNDREVTHLRAGDTYRYR